MYSDSHNDPYTYIFVSYLQFSREKKMQRQKINTSFLRNLYIVRNNKKKNFFYKLQVIFNNF